MSTVSAPATAERDDDLADMAAMCAAMLRTLATRWRERVRAGNIGEHSLRATLQLAGSLERAATLLDGGRDERGGAATDDHRVTLERDVLRSEERFRLLVDAVQDYAIFMLDPTGVIQTWNAGARRLKGYEASEIIGKHFSTFYTPEDLATDKPGRELVIAAREGKYEEEGWRLRKDGTRFWANVLITAIIDDTGQVLGFAKVTRDLSERRAAQQALERAAAELEARVVERTEQLAQANEKLEASNKELEAFGYSVSHDLRAPLRALDGFSNRVLASAGDRLTESERDQLQRVRAAAQRMSQLIDDMLSLSKLTRVEVTRSDVDVSALAAAVFDELRRGEPAREVAVTIAPDLRAHADARLVRIVLDNLLGNAWKFTRKRGADAQIEVGVRRDGDRDVFFVRDNGAGFDLRYADKLYLPFQRLHSAREYEGTGIGLAIVQRIVRRHGGNVEADSAPDAGATFSFTLEGGS